MLYSGISPMQGLHQTAQKSMTVTFPRRSLLSTTLPSNSFNLNFDNGRGRSAPAKTGVTSSAAAITNHAGAEIPPRPPCLHGLTAETAISGFTGRIKATKRWIRFEGDPGCSGAPNEFH